MAPCRITGDKFISKRNSVQIDHQSLNELCFSEDGLPKHFATLQLVVNVSFKVKSADVVHDDRQIVLVLSIRCDTLNLTAISSLLSAKTSR